MRAHDRREQARATIEITEQIAAALRDQGVQTDVRLVGEVDLVDDYAAVVLGSAVYAGHWLKPAHAFARRMASPLAARPTWLFSSGPIGHPDGIARTLQVGLSPS